MRKILHTAWIFALLISTGLHVPIVPQQDGTETTPNQNGSQNVLDQSDTRQDGPQDQRREVRIETELSGENVSVNAGRLKYTPCTFNLQPGDIIEFKRFKYVYRGKSRLKFEEKENENVEICSVNGKVFGIRINDEPEDLPASLSGDPLEHITLEKGPLDRTDIRDLQQLSTLRTLTLKFPITDQKMDRLSEISSLRSLEMDASKLTEKGSSHLAKLSSLYSLILLNPNFNEGQASYFTELSSLHTLRLFGTGLDLNSKVLSQLSKLRSLRSLNLSNTNLTDEGLSYVTGLSSLRFLNLRGTNVSDEGLSYLTGLPSLRFVDVTETVVSEEGTLRFKKEYYLNRKFDTLNRKQENRVNELIDRLGVRDYRRRENARKKLLKIGPKAMYYLKRNLDSDTPEIRSQIQLILRNILKNIDLRVRYHSS